MSRQGRSPVPPRGALILLLGTPAAVQAGCRYLQPIGSSGNTPIVSKQVGPGRLLGKTNWNTDFIVDRPYASYRFLFRANSSSPTATYPVEGTMKFSDGTSLQVFSQQLNLPVGGQKLFGPFRAVPGKQASQMNFKVGGDPSSLGFSYQISVEGCD